MDIDQQLKENIREEILNIPKELQNAIENFKFHDIFNDIGKKYKFSEEEMKIIETETILVLIGLVDPISYSKNIENNVITSEQVANNIYEEIKEKIFVPIYENIFTKNKENGDVKINTNEEISSKKEEITMNNELLMTSENTEDEVPKPPYAEIINNEELIIKNEKKVVEEDEVPKPPYAEVITDYQLPITNKETPIPEENTVQEKKSDVFENKLNGSVTGGSNVSEYNSKTPDPYREPF